MYPNIYIDYENICLFLIQCRESRIQFPSAWVSNCISKLLLCICSSSSSWNCSLCIRCPSFGLQWAWKKGFLLSRWWGSCHTKEDEWHDYNFCWTVSQFTGLDFSLLLFYKITYISTLRSTQISLGFFLLAKLHCVLSNHS